MLNRLLTVKTQGQVPTYEVGNQPNLLQDFKLTVVAVGSILGEFSLSVPLYMTLNLRFILTTSGPFVHVLLSL